MACYTKENNTENVTASTGEINVVIKDKWKTNGKLTAELKKLFQKAANQYGGIDWKWVAALSYCESTWNSSVVSGFGYSYEGLCGFSQETITNTLGKGHSSKNAEDQAMAAAKNLNENYKYAKNKLNFDEESAYLYAGIAHNAGVGGAGWAYKNATPKTIKGMTYALLNCDGGYGQHGHKSGWRGFKKMSLTEQNRQSREKAEYPSKMKSAYISIKD